jgi:hypothetical protein
MVRRYDDVETVRTPTGAHPTGGEPGRGRSRGPWGWLIALLALIAIGIALFFLLGGDVDLESEGQFDVEVPEVDADVAPPDVDLEGGDLPEVEGGELPEVEVEPGDAEAEVPGDTAPAAGG